MKIIVLIGLILFIFLIFKMFSSRSNIKKNQNEKTIDLEKDPKTPKNIPDSLIYYFFQNDQIIV